LSNLLARHAESIFWLARQVERANSIARILDVNESFSRNSRGEHDWESVLRLFADEQVFRALNCALVTWRTNRTISNKNPIAYLKERADNSALGEECNPPSARLRH
jgi:uncharacterized alpha-E superfamily protein